MRWRIREEVNNRIEWCSTTAAFGLVWNPWQQSTSILIFHSVSNGKAREREVLWGSAMMPGVKRHEFFLNQKKQSNKQTNKHIYGVYVLHLYSQDGFTNFKCLNTQCVFIETFRKVPQEMERKLHLSRLWITNIHRTHPYRWTICRAFLAPNTFWMVEKKTYARHFHTWIRKNVLKKFFFSFFFISLFIRCHSVRRWYIFTRVLKSFRCRICWCYLAAYNKFCTKS